MSSPSTVNVFHPSNKRNASSLKTRPNPKMKKSIEKATISYSPSPSPSSDFTLYPEDTTIEMNSSDRRARTRRVREELISDGLLPSAKKGDEVPREKRVASQQHPTRRRSKVDQPPLIHQSKMDSQQNGIRLPPAPSPPRLGTPDLDDIDEDLWSCCSWSESSAETYIAATKLSQGKMKQNIV